MPSTRVVITGLGAVSPFGVGRDRFWEGISRGQSGIRAMSDLDPDIFACRVAAPVPDDALAAGRVWFPAHLSLGAILEKQIERFLGERAVPFANTWYGPGTRLSAWSTESAGSDPDETRT